MIAQAVSARITTISPALVAAIRQEEIAVQALLLVLVIIVWVVLAAFQIPTVVAPARR